MANDKRIDELEGRVEAIENALRGRGMLAPSGPSWGDIMAEARAGYEAPERPAAAAGDVPPADQRPRPGDDLPPSVREAVAAVMAGAQS